MVEILIYSFGNFAAKVCFRYLTSVGYKKAKKFKEKEIVPVKLNCQSWKPDNEGGIFLMRHTEAHMGEDAEKWDCELASIWGS